MKKILQLFAFMFLTSTAFGQEVVKVAPDEGLNAGALNAAIEQYTNTVIYELERGGIYYLSKRITTQWDLHIRAEEGEGERPILQYAADENNEIDRLFSLGGNTKLEGLYLTNKADNGDDAGNTIRAEVKDIRLEFIDCMFDHSYKAPLRIQVSGTSTFFKGCYFRNVWNPNDPGDSKVVDTRGNETDTIWFDNCTIMHTGDLITRTDDGFLKYLHFDHNTAYVLGDCLDLNITLEAVVTNNIFYNVLWQMSDTLGGSGPEAYFHVDSLGTLGEYTDADRSFKLTNNNFFVEQKYYDFLSGDGSGFVKPLFSDENCANFIASGQMDTTNIISEALIFENPPAAPLAYIKLWHDNLGTMDGVDVPDESLPFADLDLMNPGGENDFSLKYNSNSKSATASATGGPLGAAMWFDTTVGINELVKTDHFSLYPNPAENKIFITFKENQLTSLQLGIYNMAGTKVKDQSFFGVAPSSKVEVDVSDLSTGVYIFRALLENGKIRDGKLIIKK